MEEVVLESEPLCGLNLIIANKIYEEASVCLEELYRNPSVDDMILIMKTLTTASALSELVKVNDKKVKGREKKRIVVYVSHRLFKDFIHEMHLPRIRDAFERVSDELIEIVIDFAKNNKVLRTISSQCSFLSC
tara:strand:+ start:829 stop:1227 length:399 start_codon:yes stop_codon:yes gene_type:complete